MQTKMYNRKKYNNIKDTPRRGDDYKVLEESRIVNFLCFSLTW